MLHKLRDYIYDTFLSKKHERQHYERYVKGVSPFANQLDRNWYNENWTRIMLMTILVVPIRAFFLVFFIFLAYLAAKFTVIFLKKKRSYDSESDEDFPMYRSERRGRDLAATFLICADIAAGYYTINIKGKKATPKEAPIIAMSPHTGWFDSLGYCTMLAPSIISKTALMDLPIMGTLLRVTNPVCVDRDNADSRKNTMAKIRQRVEHINAETPDGGHYPQLCLFPESTTTSSNMLLQFKTGAFQPGVPVQPVVFHFRKKPDLVSYTYDGMPWWALIWLNMCDFTSEFTLEYLPVHIPNNEEKMRPELFAKRAQESVAQAMSVSASDYTFEDIYHLVYNVHFAPKMNFLQHLLAKVDWQPESSSTQSLAQAHRDFKNNHVITLLNKDQFVQYIQRHKSEPLAHLNDNYMSRLFNAFDWKFERRIDMREYLVARYCTFDSNDLLVAREIFDIKSDDEAVSDEIFRKLVRVPFTLSHKQVYDEYRWLSSLHPPTWDQVGEWCMRKTSAPI